MFFSYLNKNTIFLDFLTIRLKKYKINPFFFSCVENSNKRELYNYLDFEFYLEYDGFYGTHTIYYILDKNNNKMCQICIENETNKKFEIFDKITFYGEYFNLYHYYYSGIMEKIFYFFGIDNDNAVTRFDLRCDIQEPMYNFCFKSELSEKIKTFGTTWKNYSNKNNGYEIRFYDKNLDSYQNHYNVVDNFGDYHYKNIVDYNLQNNIALTRLEIQYNSRIIRKSNWTLENILNQDFQEKKFKNYIIENFILDTKLDLKKTRDNNKNENLVLQKKIDDDYERTKNMAQTYLKKMQSIKPMNFQKQLMILLDNLKLENDFFSDYLLTIDNTKTKYIQSLQEKLKEKNAQITNLKKGLHLEKEVRKIFDN